MVRQNPRVSSLIGHGGEAVTPDQIARVFVKFVKDSPEWLDKPAYLAIETACMKDGLLIAGKPDFLPNYTSVPNDGKHPIRPAGK